MKIYIETDELYPFYWLTTDEDKYSPSFDVIDAPEETIKRWLAAHEACFQARREIRAQLEEQDKIARFREKHSRAERNQARREAKYPTAIGYECNGHLTCVACYSYKPKDFPGVKPVSEDKLDDKCDICGETLIAGINRTRSW